MPKTVLLHIGTPKTGSKSIQQCLARAQVDGALAPFSYPLWRDGLPHQKSMVMLYRSHDQLDGGLRYAYPRNDRRFRRERRGYRRFFFDELRSSDDGVVISSETLCGYAEPEVTQLRDDLESLGFGEFHVVIYIRDPADFYLSRTQQILKWPGSGPSRLLSRMRQANEATTVDQQFVIDPAAFIYDFRRAVETWERVFPGRLIVRPFPGGPQGDVTDDFADVLKELIGVSLTRSSTRSNRTLSAEGMQILQGYRKTFWANSFLVTPDTYGLVRFLEESLKTTPQTKPVLREELATRIRSNHVEDAEFIYQRYGVDLGLRNLMPTNASSESRTYRIDEIVESLDRDIVDALLLQLARSELRRTAVARPLPLRLAARAYHLIPGTGSTPRTRRRSR